MTAASATLSVDELVRLCSVDNELFEKTFFPKASRQPSAPFHKEMWTHLEDPSKRFLNLVCFRDSAKTTKLRIFTGKRIAFNTSKTILYVGSSESHAVRSIQWIRSRIEERIGGDGTARRELYGQVFGLRQGKKWTDTELEIYHGVDDQPIWILGVGITGNIRGINFEDYRPDLIVLDDVLTDENAATAEQRNKITDLVTGALKNSLAPSSESPNAKLVMLNTPQHGDDVVARAEKDPEWFSAKYSCWTPETQGLPIDQQVSSWEARHSSEGRRQEKRNAIAANRLSSFVKEKEVRVVTKENSIFFDHWLKYYTDPPEQGQTVLFIDPTPPAEGKDKKAVNKLDYEVVGALRRYNGEFFLLDYELIQGSNPSWTIAKFFQMVAKWRPYKAIVEGVNYQKTLKWILEQEMTRRQQWVTVETPPSIKAKSIRIQTALHGIASQGKFYCRADHSEFIEQFSTFPSCDHDDVLDGVSMGVVGLTNAFVDLAEGRNGLDNSNIRRLRPARGCP
jgi:hypothetical protein